MKRTLLATAVLLSIASCTIASETTIQIDGKTADLSDLNNSTNNNVEITGTGTYPILTKDQDTIIVLGSKINIRSFDNAGLTGIRANNDSSITIGDEKTEGLTITSKNTPFGVGSIAFINGKVNLTAKEINIDTEYAGLWAQHNNDQASATEDHATVNVVANKTTINAGHVGIIAFSGSEINITGDLEVNAPQVINTRGNSTVNINKDKKGSVQLNGDIAFNTPGSQANSGSYINSNVNIYLVGADSYWNGNASYGYPEGNKAYPDTTKVNNFSLTLQDGAAWTPNVFTLDPTSGMTEGQLSIPNVTLNDGVINLKKDVEVSVENLSGNGTINLATDGSSSGTLKVTSGTDATLTVNLMNSDLNQNLTADDITADQAKTLLTNVGDGSGASVSTNVSEGMVNPAFAVDATGTVKTASANTLMQSSLELATAAPLALNRIMMNDVRKRLGDIRTSNGTSGAWARYDGGKLSGNGGLDTDFTTIQVGVDTMPGSDPLRLGLAFSYTDGDADYARGSADMKAYGLAAYGTWLGEKGQFVDVVARFGKADTDMTVDGSKKGNMKNYALSISGEFGWHFNITDVFYTEPQVEATYTYVDGDDLTLGTAQYEVDSMNSFLARAGLAAGFKCPNDRGNAYVRASVVHEFLGDTKITGTNGNVRSTYETNGEDTWVEYGLGANFNVSKSTYVWADVERTSGGSLDEDWRATVGVRYAW